MPLQSGMKPLCKKGSQTVTRRLSGVNIYPRNTEAKTDNKTVILMRIIRFSEMEY